MRWLLALALLQGCLQDFEKRAPPSARLAWRVEDISYRRHNHKTLTIALNISGNKTSLAQIKKHLLLVRAPTKDELKDEEVVNPLPFGISKAPDSAIVFMKPKSHLVADVTYGIYGRQLLQEQWVLMYAFTLRHEQPRMVSHDVGAFDTPLVSDKRIMFTFQFDQPMVLDDEQALSLINLDGAQASKPFERIVLSHDQKTITVRLSQHAEPTLTAGKRYGFFFGHGLRSIHGEGVRDTSLEFLAVKDTGHFLVTNPLALSHSDSQAELFMGFSQGYQGEWYMAEAGHSFDCLGAQCPINGSSLRIHDEKKPLAFQVNRFAITGLKPATQYKWLARVENIEGRIMVARGHLMTQAVQNLRISEIMINPSIKKGERQSDYEYIEIANVSDNDVVISGLYLKLEDNKNNEFTDCEVVSALKPLLVPKKGHFLIVAQGFDKSRYGLNDGVMVVTLGSKTLCGGLNKSSKTVKIHWGDGHFIDRYGGHLWSAPKGTSVQRINITGLDEPNNYCYSDPAMHTPGRPNGPCGT